MDGQGWTDTAGGAKILLFIRNIHHLCSIFWISNYVNRIAQALVARVDFYGFQRFKICDYPRLVGLIVKVQRSAAKPRSFSKGARIFHNEALVAIGVAWMGLVDVFWYFLQDWNVQVSSVTVEIHWIGINIAKRRIAYACLHIFIKRIHVFVKAIN